MHTHRGGLVLLAGWFAAAPLAARGAESAAAVAARGVAYLTSVQGAEGSFSPEAGPGVTALAAAALLAHGQTPADPAVARALQYVESHIRPDGGIYAADSMYKNYETSIAVLALARANADGRYNATIDRAVAFLKGEQWDESEDLSPDDPAYGGAGYGRHSRPDLSNTSFLIDALRAAGTSPEDPAMQRALAFVSRCQNLPSEHNQTEFPAKNPDGGFYYTIAAGGSSQAGAEPDGGLRSYGSMTYAGLKSMIYAGVGPDDPRVRAAREWIGRHYRLDENPGMGDAGLYYYFHTFAKALDATGEAAVTDAAGASHDWRADLTAALAAAQQADGSWVNRNERWLEGDPQLVTAYALLALSYCQ